MKKMIDYKIYQNNPEEFKYLYNCFPTVSDFNDLFNTLSQKTQDLITLNIMDADDFMMSFMSKHGNKKISSLIDLLLLQGNPLEKKGNYYTLSRYNTYIIGQTISARYYKKWEKIINTFNITYNPIKPYDMEINDDISEKTDNNVLIKRLNESNSENESSDKVINDETDNSMYGFNSINPVPTDKSINKSENVSNDKNTYNSSGSTDTEQNKEVTNERVIKRLGNIGNTSQQELIEKEIELRQYEIIETIFSDISKVLTCGCY